MLSPLTSPTLHFYCYAPFAEYQNNLDAINFLMNDLSMPSDLRRRMRAYMRSTKDTKKRLGYVKLVEDNFSRELQEEIRYSMSGHLLARAVPFFTEIYDDDGNTFPSRAQFFERVSTGVRRQAFAPHEQIADPNAFLSIVTHGVGAKAQEILLKGSCFGQDTIVSSPALRDNRPVRCLTYLEVARIPRAHLLEVLDEPQVRVCVCMHEACTGTGMLHACMHARSSSLAPTACMHAQACFMHACTVLLSSPRTMIPLGDMPSSPIPSPWLMRACRQRGRIHFFGCAKITDAAGGGGSGGQGGASPGRRQEPSAAGASNGSPGWAEARRRQKMMMTADGGGGGGGGRRGGGSGDGGNGKAPAVTPSPPPSWAPSPPSEDTSPDRNPIRDPHILMTRPTLDASHARFLAGYPITAEELDAISERNALRAAADKAEVDELRRREERDGGESLTAGEQARIAKSDADKVRILALAETLARGWSFIGNDERQFDPFGRHSASRNQGMQPMEGMRY